MRKDKKNILQHAEEIVFQRSEEKERQYGPFTKSMEDAAKIATILTDKTISGPDMYKCMIALKMSRLAYYYKYDSTLDAIAYLAAYNEYMDPKKESKISITLEEAKENLIKAKKIFFNLKDCNEL